MPYFSAGDTVTIRYDLIAYNMVYHMDGVSVGIIANEMMVRRAGSTAKIRSIVTRGTGLPYYLMDIDNGRFLWTDEMFNEYINQDAQNEVEDIVPGELAGLLL